MMTRLGEGDGDTDKVEVTFTEQQMTIKLSGQFPSATDGYQSYQAFRSVLQSCGGPENFQISLTGQQMAVKLLGQFYRATDGHEAFRSDLQSNR